jgi:N-carbamoylputrescine amidase
MNATGTEPQDSSKRPLHPGLRVALAQIPLEDGDLARNMQIAEKAACDASVHKPDFLCFPEAIDFGWLHQAARNDALPIPGKYTEFLAKLAVRHKTWICAGCLERDGERVYNSAVVLDRGGRIVHKHRKIRTLPKLTSHLYDAAEMPEQMTFPTEFGRIGLTICADNFDISIPQRAAQAGAWLLITPHGFAAPVADMEKNARAFRSHIRRIAAQTGMWVVGTNVVQARVKGGAWEGQMHCGRSMVARPDGTTAAVGKFNEPDLIVYDIPSAV